MSEQPVDTPGQTEKAPTTEVSKTKEVATPVQKPMGATQRRDLSKLIDGEFESLKGELNVFANQLKIRRHQEIEAQFEEQERDGRRVEAEWLEFAQGLRRQADEWLRGKREEGFVVTASGRYGGDQPISVNPITVGLPAKERAIREADNIVTHQKMTAVQGLERQRLQLQKDLLLDGLVSDKAKEFLSKMPNPRELLAQVMQGAREAGLAPIDAPRVQQIEGGVQVHHDHGDQQAVYIGEVME